MTFDRTVRNNKILVNSAQVVSGSGWVHDGDGTLLLEENLSAKVAVYPLQVPVGKKIVKFTIKGALGATTGNATVIDADLRKVTGGAGDVTDASVAAITQVSVVADTELDSSKGVGEIVREGYQYYVKVVGTTANNAACDAKVTGIEVELA